MLSSHPFVIGMTNCLFDLLFAFSYILSLQAELDKILKVVPRDRNTYLFSATMTKKV